MADIRASDKNPAVKVPLATGMIDVVDHASGKTVVSAAVSATGVWTEIMLPLGATAKTYALDVRYSGDGNYGGKMVGSFVVEVR